MLVREIEAIGFGIFSAKEIAKISVCKIDNSRKSGPNSVYDLRLGAVNNNDICETCGEGPKDCPGHFGHIELEEEVLHPLYTKHVLPLLKSYCTKCSRLLLSKDQIYIRGLNKYKDNQRFNKVVEVCSKVDICCHTDSEGNMCGNQQPNIKLNKTDGTISMVYTDKSKNKTSIVLSSTDIRRILDKVRDEDVELMGFNPKMVHPRNFIISNLLVLPPCCRPFVKADGNISDDDLTIQYIEIVKANNHLADTTLSEVSRQKHLQTIKFRIHTSFDNSKGKAKHTTNNQPIKCIKSRLTAKEGQIRGNIMAKRVNHSARTVIGPDPTLKLNQIGVPIDMSIILTIPERVTNFNKDELTKLVNDGKANFVINSKGVFINLKKYRSGSRLIPGDIIMRDEDLIEVVTGKETLKIGDQIMRNGENLKNVKYPNRKYDLKIGDVVERHLRDGDVVLLNRQPTLHKGSMMGKEVVIKQYKTFRMNLACTKSFNADFDGDEMNIHTAQSPETQAELRLLSMTKWNIISPQAGKPNICIVQDSLLGAYKMTLGIQKITKEEFFNISMVLEEYKTGGQVLDRIKHIVKIFKEKNKPVNPYTGMGIASLLFPEDFIYEKKTNANPDEPVLKIYRGVLYEGTMNKSVLGTSYNSLIQVICKEYGEDRAAQFIDGIQFVTNEWLRIKGASVGIRDCLIPGGRKKEKEIADSTQKYFIEAEGVKSTTTHPGIREIRINAALGKAKDVGLRIAKESLDKSNNFISTVTSGSKGDMFNITQITGLLGQQNLSGARVPKQLNNGTRTLHHYPYEDLTPEMEYESRGFISSSFIKGLNPREFFFHAMSGREGVADTATGTATSGYMQRRIVKLTEDIKIEYDGSARDTTGRVYQFVYEGRGYDPSKLVRVNGKPQACDIGRLADKLNLKYMDSSL